MGIGADLLCGESKRTLLYLNSNPPSLHNSHSEYVIQVARILLVR